MKATKKIVGAAVALVAAVALSAGSTFAWFAANGTVDVTGMQVQAKIPSSLLIAANLATGTSDAASGTSLAVYNSSTSKSGVVSKSDTVFSSSGADMDDSTATSLQPVHITYDSGLKFGTAASSKTNWADADEETTAIKWTVDQTDETEAWDSIVAPASSSATGASNAAAALSPYANFYNMSFYLPSSDSTGSSNQDLNVTVTLNSSSDVGDKQLKFLHVGFLASAVNGDTKTWTTTFNSTYKYGITAVSNNTVTYNVTDVLTRISYNTYYNVLVVVYFDGADVDCYNDNALNTEALSVELAFETAADETTTGYTDYTYADSTGGTETTIWYNQAEQKFYTSSNNAPSSSETVQITANSTDDGYVFKIGELAGYYTLSGKTFTKLSATTAGKTTVYKIGENWYTVDTSGTTSVFTAVTSSTVGTTNVYSVSDVWYTISESSGNYTATAASETNSNTGTICTAEADDTKVYWECGDSVETYYTYNSLAKAFVAVNSITAGKTTYYYINNTYYTASTIGSFTEATYTTGTYTSDNTTVTAISFDYTSTASVGSWYILASTGTLKEVANSTSITLTGTNTTITTSST